MLGCIQQSVYINYVREDAIISDGVTQILILTQLWLTFRFKLILRSSSGNYA